MPGNQWATVPQATVAGNRFGPNQALSLQTGRINRQYLRD